MRGIGCLQLFKFFLNERTHFFDAVFSTTNLKAGLVAVAFVAVLVEDLNDGFAGLQYFVCRHKLRQEFSQMRGGAQAAAYDDLEAANSVLDLGVHADVVDRSQATAFTSAEADFEFARQVLRQRMLGVNTWRPLRRRE